MNTIETSPMVANESVTGRVPIFNRQGFSPATKAINLFNSPKIKGSNQTRLEKIEFGKATLSKYMKPRASVHEGCKCPHVLAADDDSFEHFFYQNLFQKSLDFEQIDIKKHDFKAELFQSGEDLLARYNLIHSCGCQKLRVIITDYHMGLNKLSGVQTADKLKRAGYKGPILLRTSEKRVDLAETHVDLDQMVDFVIEKSDVKTGKDIITKFLKQ